MLKDKIREILIGITGFDIKKANDQILLAIEEDKDFFRGKDIYGKYYEMKTKAEQQVLDEIRKYRGYEVKGEPFTKEGAYSGEELSELIVNIVNEIKFWQERLKEK